MNGQRVRPCPPVETLAKMRTRSSISKKPSHVPLARCNQNPTSWKSVLASLLVLAEEPLGCSWLTSSLRFMRQAPTPRLLAATGHRRRGQWAETEWSVSHDAFSSQDSVSLFSQLCCHCSPTFASPLSTAASQAYRADGLCAPDARTHSAYRCNRIFSELSAVDCHFQGGCASTWIAIR